MGGIRLISRGIFNRERGRPPVQGRSIPLVLGLTLSLAVLSEVHAESSLCEVSERALHLASTIRGIRPRSKVPCVVHSREEVATFLKFQIAEKLPKNSLEMEGEVYRALGVVPDDYDYAKGVFEAYTREIGGYYDPDKKLFVMVDFLSPELQLPVAVHELTHALQDERFDLHKLLDPKIENSDLLLAHAALAEGDATAVMEDYLATRGSVYKAGQEPLKPSVESESLPPALREILLFPYKQGLAFARRIMKQGGYGAIDRAFGRPPRSTREILHPEEYLRGGEPPAPLSTESLERLGGVWKLNYSSSLGELVTYAMLRTTQSGWTSESCSRGLRRDVVGLFRITERKHSVSWLSEWDSARDASDFVECYREFLRTRYKKEVINGIVELTPLKEVKISQSGERVSIVVRLSEGFAGR